MAIHDQYQKIVPFVLFAIALFLLFKLIQPMISILLSSILLAYITFPLQKRIIKKVSNKPLSIVLSLFIIVIILLIPLTFLTFRVVQQGNIFSHSLSNNIEKGALFGLGCTSSDSEVCLVLNQAEKFSLEQLSKMGFDKQLQKLLPVIEEKITSFIFKIPLILAGIFLTLIISYFILKDWENMLKKVVDFLPIRKKTIKKLISEFGDITHTVIFVQLFVAFSQGIIAMLGFYIFGIPFPLFFGVLVAFCALIPAIGTVVVWLPASLYLILMGHFSQDSSILGKGIGLFFYGLLIISTIDNFLLAKIVNVRTKVSQVTVMVGVIGGAILFGLPGIFIGPILLPLLITYLKTF